MKWLFCFKTRQDFPINCDAIELLCLEMKNKKSENFIVNFRYSPTNRDGKEFEKHLKNT